MGLGNINVIAIIPARGGSKGVPRKNILPVGGIPLITHTINHAKNASSINDVWVTTDDPEIADVSKSAGAKLIKRPFDLSLDEVSSEDVLIHALNTLNKDGIYPDIVVFLQCTSPFRRNNDIDEAFKEYQKGCYDSLLSVSPSHRFLWKKSMDSAVSLNYDYVKRPRRQDMDEQFVENGSIYIFKPKNLMASKNRLSGKVGIYVMDDTASIEIDSYTDLKVAESIMLSLTK